jgi:hypothetical protein
VTLAPFTIVIRKSLSEGRGVLENDLCSSKTPKKKFHNTLNESEVEDGRFIIFVPQNALAVDRPRSVRTKDRNPNLATIPAGTVVPKCLVPK